MKYRGILIIAAVLGAGGLWLLQNKSYKSHTTYNSQAAPLPYSAVTDPATVFQKAFWKRPTRMDQILHAERREWTEDGAVSRWQWFLVVEPSPEIVSHLREQNAFRLIPDDSLKIPANAPSWFSPGSEELRVLSNAGGTMQLAFTTGDRLLHATGSGGGFKPGVAEAAVPAAIPAPVSAGRMPLEPPPITETP